MPPPYTFAIFEREEEKEAARNDDLALQLAIVLPLILDCILDNAREPTLELPSVLTLQAPT